MKLAAAALLLAVPQVAAPPASPPPCVSRADAADLSLYLLPALLPAVVERCRATLPATAWLTTQGPAYGERLAVGRDARWPGARRAFVNMAGGRQPPKGVSDATLRSLAEDMLRTQLPAAMKVEDCRKIDDFARLLSPLPPDNLGEFVALLMDVGSAAKPNREFDMCPFARP
jgi:hypothetical protein